MARRTRRRNGSLSPVGAVRRRTRAGQPIFKFAAMDVPFNWIFVMIAGGSILLAVFGFVQKQQKAFGEDIAQTVLRDLGAITAGASVAKGTSQAVDIPDSDIKLACTDECTCEMTIGNVPQGLKDNLVFGQDKLKGTKLILWAQDWSIPLRVTNFLFITTPRIQYYIIHKPGSKLKKALQERIPDNINVTYVADANLKPKTALSDGKKIENLGFDAVRFVILEDDPTKFLPGCYLDSSFNIADATCVSIKPNNAVAGVTAFDIFIKDKTEQNKLQFESSLFTVVGEAGALAAMFADNSVQFECNMRRAYRRLSFVSLLAAERADALEVKRLATPDICRGLTYPRITTTIANNPLQGLSAAASNLSFLPTVKGSVVLIPETGPPPPLPPPNLADKTVKDMQESLRKLLINNQNLLRQDCPLLF